MSPFDSARLQELSKGLEIAVLPLSEVLNENSKIRIDASHFSKAAVLTRKRIAGMPNEKLGDIASSFRKGIFDIKADTYVDAGDGVPFVRIGDLADGLIEEDKIAWISTDAHEKEIKTALHRDDIVLSKTAYPAASLITLKECNVSQDTIAVRLSPDGKRNFRSAYIVTFLNSSIGLTLLWSEFQGNVQQHLSLEDGKNLRIPKFGLLFQSRIQELFESAINARQAASSYIRNSEQRLLVALGLDHWTPPEPLSYTRSAKEAFAIGRLDAQYFMPAKTIVQTALADMPGATLGQRFESIREMFDPSNALADLRVRNYDVTDALASILDDEKQPSYVDEIGSIKKRLQYGDVAISRLRSYLRQIAVVRASNDMPAVGSSEFIILRPQNSKSSAIAPETLMTFLRSAPVQTILKWCQDGSQHPRFSERDLLSIHIPDSVSNISPQIEATVQEGFRVRHHARTLLAQAKRSVEIAVEESEAAALRFLNEVES
jgi:type I restriction enzyme, S subunit